MLKIFWLKRAQLPLDPHPGLKHNRMVTLQVGDPYLSIRMSPGPFPECAWTHCQVNHTGFGLGAGICPVSYPIKNSCEYLRISCAWLTLSPKFRGCLPGRQKNNYRIILTKSLILLQRKLRPRKLVRCAWDYFVGSIKERVGTRFLTLMSLSFPLGHIALKHCDW